MENTKQTALSAPYPTLVRRFASALSELIGKDVPLVIETLMATQVPMSGAWLASFLSKQPLPYSSVNAESITGPAVAMAILAAGRTYSFTGPKPSNSQRANAWKRQEHCCLNGSKRSTKSYCNFRLRMPPSCWRKRSPRPASQAELHAAVRPATKWATPIQWRRPQDKSRFWRPPCIGHGSRHFEPRRRLCPTTQGERRRLDAT